MPLSDEERTERRRAAQARYRAAHRERLRETGRAYMRARRASNPCSDRLITDGSRDAAKAYYAKYRAENRERVNAASKRYHAANRDEIRAKARIKARHKRAGLDVATRVEICAKAKARQAFGPGVAIPADYIAADTLRRLILRKVREQV